MQFILKLLTVQDNQHKFEQQIHIHKVDTLIWCPYQTKCLSRHLGFRLFYDGYIIYFSLFRLSDGMVVCIVVFSALGRFLSVSAPSTVFTTKQDGVMKHHLCFFVPKTLSLLGRLQQNKNVIQIKVQSNLKRGQFLSYHVLV